MALTKTVRMSLSPQQLVEYGDQLASSEKEYELLDGERKTTAAGYRLKLKVLREKIMALATLVDEKVEEREIEVLIHKDFDRGVFQLIAKETGEVVEERELVDADRQKAVFTEMPGRGEGDN